MCKIPFIRIEHYELNTDIVKLIPEEMARCFQVVAIEKREKVLTVGMVVPEDKNAITRLESRLKLKVLPVRIEIQNWSSAINNSYLKEVKPSY